VCEIARHLREFTGAQVWPIMDLAQLRVRLTTAHPAGIPTATDRTMPTDFLTLLQRDHGDLQMELTQLLDPIATVSQLRSALDGVRLGLTAHAEAEDIVLARFEVISPLEGLVRLARGAHLAQEGALSALVTTRPGTKAWRDRAYHLRELVHDHAEQEEQHLLPALREHSPRMYAQLAGAFATERLRQLAMLQPSAPLSIADLALAEAQAL
jgi:hypothetical protein